MTQEGAPKRLALTVKSDSFEDILLALTFAGIAARLGAEVSMFFTNRAARRLRKGGLEEMETERKDELGEKFLDGASGMGLGDLHELLEQIKGTGRVRVYVCTRGSRIWGLTLENLIPEVDTVLGTQTWISDHVMRADVALVI